MAQSKLEYRVDELEKHIDELEKNMRAREKESIRKERQALITGIGALGAFIISLFGVIWTYRAAIFKGGE